MFYKRLCFCFPPPYRAIHIFLPAFVRSFFLYKNLLNRNTMLFMAGATGLIVANIYYIQLLVPLVAFTFGISELEASAATYYTQVGYTLR